MPLRYLLGTIPSVAVVVLTLSPLIAHCDSEKTVMLPDNPYMLDPEKACGLHCVGFICAYVGGKVDYKEIATLCPPARQGTSFRSLQRCVEALGYHTRAVKVPIKSIVGSGYPAIVHIADERQGGHFVVVAGGTGRDTPIVFSPPNTVADLALNDLEPRYSGIALFVSADEIRLPFGVTGYQRRRAALRVVGVFAGALLCALGALRMWRRNRNAKPSACFVGLVILVLMAGCSCESSAAPEKLQSVEREASIPATHDGLSAEQPKVDKGDVLIGTPLRHTFLVRNMSADPITVVDVAKSCTCQTVRVTIGTAVPVGSAFAVDVSLRTQGLVGVQAARITLHTDSSDVRYREIQLELSGNLVTEVQSVPPQIVFGRISGPQRIGRRLHLRSDTPGLLDSFARVRSTHPQLEAVLSGKAPDELTFDVAVLENMSEGDFVGELQFYFGTSATPKLSTRVVGKKTATYFAIPSDIRRRVGPHGTLELGNVRIQRADRQPFQLVSATGPSGVQVAPLNKGPSEYVVLSVSIAGHYPASIIEGALIVITDSDAKAILRIPVRIDVED